MGLLTIKEFKEGKRVDRTRPKDRQINALEELTKQSEELGLCDNASNPMTKDLIN